MNATIAAVPQKHHKEVIVVDGSNVCFAERDELQRPRLGNLVTVRRMLLDHDFDPIIFCDANLPYLIDEGDQLGALISRGDVHVVPAGTDADVWVLEAAAEFDARIVTNDLYRQHVGRFPRVMERRVAVMVVNGRVLLPGLIEPPVAQPISDIRHHDGSASTPGSTVVQLDLVQELLAENAAIRISRDLLVEECQRLRAQTAQSSQDAANWRREQDRVASLLAALEVRTGELATQLRDAAASLADALQSSVQANLARESAEATANEARHQVHSLTDQVRLLERQNRPLDAESDKVTQRLLRDILRDLRLQTEPIQRAATQASETRKLVDALRAGLQTLSSHAEAISTYLDQHQAVARADAGEPAIGAEAEPTAAAIWQTRFSRVEQAWLANEDVQDTLEAQNFRHCIQKLRLHDRSLIEEDVLLTTLDDFKARVGAGFCYAALYDAVKQTRKPTLKSSALLVRTRDAVRSRGRMPTTESSQGGDAA